MSLTRKLGRQVKESLRTVDIFINSLQNKDSDSTEEIKVKLLDLKEKLQEVSGYFDQVEADKSRAVKDGADLDYRSFMTEISQRRVVSPLRELTNVFTRMPPDTIFIGVGAPNPNLYPFESVSVKLKDGSSLQLPEAKLKPVLSYLPSRGHKPLPLLLQEFQDKIHGPQDWTKKSILVTNGSQEGTYLAVNMMCNPGDPILVQNPSYPGFTEIINPMGLEIIPVNMDANGMIPERLAHILEERSQMKDKQMPKVMYVNPTASNPTGTLLTDARKKEIYKIAQQYNLIILEDDPYYMVHFLDKDPVSFLALDTDNRVIRFDSFSKTMSAGLRMGFATGPAEFIERMDFHLQITTMMTSGLSQLLIYELLNSWGFEGYRDYVKKVRDFYRGQRDFTLRAAEKHLTGLATWTTPQGGMFLWLKVKPVRCLKTLVTKELVNNKLLVAPGYAFTWDPTDDSQYVRVSYSLTTEEAINKGFSILAEAIKENMV